MPEPTLCDLLITGGTALDLDGATLVSVDPAELRSAAEAAFRPVRLRS